MCRGTVEDGGGFRPRGGRRLEVRAFYLRMSTSSAALPPAVLSLVYHPAIGGAALELGGQALPPASPAEVTLLRVGDAGGAGAAAYASNDRVSAAEGARFEVYAGKGKELAAEGVFDFNARCRGGGWRVECRRAMASQSRQAVVAEVVVLAEGGVLVRGKARAASPRLMGCGTTRLDGIPEEAAWGSCECGTCGEEWEVVGDDRDDGDEWKGHEVEMVAELETVRWVLEMGAWAVCVGVGLLATASRFRRKRAFR